MSSRGSAPRVVVVGSIMVDLIAYADPLPRLGETVRGSAFHFGFGGKGANQAVTAHRLGADVALVACVGDDRFGDMTIENLVAQGMSTATIRRIDGWTTGVAPIWVEADGGNRIIVVPGANDALAAGFVADALSRASVDCLVCQLEVPDEAVAAALGAQSALGAVRILNPAPASADAVALFGAADWVVPNEHEFELLWGSKPTDAAILAAADAWACGLIVTLGAEGAAATVDGEVLRSLPPSVEVVDTTGAGDAFVGGLAYAFAAGMPVTAAVELGNVCGALSTERRGTQSSFPTREAVEQASNLERL